MYVLITLALYVGIYLILDQYGVTEANLGYWGILLIALCLYITGRIEGRRERK